MKVIQNIIKTTIGFLFLLFFTSSCSNETNSSNSQNTHRNTKVSRTSYSVSIEEFKTQRNYDSNTVQNGIAIDSTINQKSKSVKFFNQFQDYSSIKIGHHVNTVAHEYLPVLQNETNNLLFTGMDRTGFFDYKIDYTKVPSSGGEDIFISENKDGIWSDARPFNLLNTNSHEAITCSDRKNHYVVCGNYSEKLGPKRNTNGAETTDLFEVSVNDSKVQINHYPEPLNSIYTEADGILLNHGKVMIFVSDRPGHVGSYHKKGWRWNDNTWGNTDVYVSFCNDGYWSVPKSLGQPVNTTGAERSPWLSDDRLTLYLSSNGYESTQDLNIYAFTRASADDWTHWNGPFKLNIFCSSGDDWGFKYYTNFGVVYSRSFDLGFKPTQLGKDGDGGIRETNFRTGYELWGAQIAALHSNYGTDIYWGLPPQIPFFTMRDVLFDVNSNQIQKSFYPTLDRLADWCNMNTTKTLSIIGHCDNSGNDKQNDALSIKRAEELKKYLISKGVSIQIKTEGRGAREPIETNTSKWGRQKNRRVVCLLN